MSLKIQYEKGPSLDKSYFVASETNADGTVNKFAVRASKILEPKLHKVANDDNNDAEPKVEVQPEDFVAKFEEKCPDLESFKNLACAMAVKNENVVVTAAKESDAPTMSTEPLDKVKVDKEPVIAAEETMVADKLKTESSPEVRKYFGKLPGKTTGSPEMALDLQSKLQATQEQLKTILAENEELKKDNEGMKKAGESEKVLKLLGELGVIEDDKDKDAYAKKLAGLNDQALGVLESILKEVAGSEGDSKPAAGGPGKPPMAPKKPEPKGMPAGLDGHANLMHASYEDSIGIAASNLGDLWLKTDRAKELA